MKKLIFTLALLTPFAVFGATQAIKEYNLWENFASLKVSSSNVVNFIKIDDPNDPTVKCYVAVSYPYTEKAYINSMSCLKVK